MSRSCRHRLGPAGLLVLAAATSGCGSPTPSARRPAPREDAPPPDYSLTAAEYRKLGLPVPARPWSAADMSQAAVVLDTLARRHPEQLPRYQSDVSGKVFARLTSADQLKTFRDRSVPIAKRLTQALDCEAAIKQVAESYMAAARARAVGDPELVEMLGTLLRLAVVISVLADEFRPTLNPKDPAYAEGADQLAQIRDELAATVAGSVLALEKSRLRPADLSRLVGHIQDTFPVLVPRLLPKARADTLKRLEALTRVPLLKGLQVNVRRLHEKLKQAAAKDRAP